MTGALSHALTSWPLPWIAVLAILAIVLVAALAAALRRARKFPYTRQATLFTPAERSFLSVLEAAVAPGQRVFGKIRIADVLQVRHGLDRSRNQAAFNRIAAKHFDFVVCRRSDLAPLCAIELDDASHARRAAHAGDAFKNGACATAGLPLIRVRARRGYAIEEIRNQVAAALDASEAGPAANRRRA